MTAFEYFSFYESKNWSRFYEVLVYFFLYVVGYWSTKISGFETMKNEPNRELLRKFSQLASCLLMSEY